ncbi:MAG: hypothetical protein M1814_004918 [Vezdaea aestivalis]|nr:MAG: hypothetical protein M1814_004918 [Vezdaea aestivalis]
MVNLENGTHFRKIQSFETDYSTSVFTQYESTRTGMRSVVIDRKGPKIKGYFALATEIFDDSGAPHTLEHLVFMGSKNYRYKGFLDKLATRAYSFTNAWTATDHTAYTLETAGWQGFAQILPIYLEHVLLPTLTDAGCYTEVHHVDGEGNDAGVVYSEMQGVQNDAYELMDLKARRLIYPENIGFRYETGGMMEQLRILTAARIREFHKAMYQPKNLGLVIAGEADHANLLDILEAFEDSIVGEFPSIKEPWQRPWIDSPQPPPIAKSAIQTVEFPDEDESMGSVLIGFLGPDCNDALLSSALAVLLQYLGGSSISILENILVEKESIASSIMRDTENRPDSLISFFLSGVETPKLAHVERRFFEVLTDVMAQPLNTEYLLDCVHRTKRQIKAEVEKSGSLFATTVIYDHLFGNRNGSTLEDAKTLKGFDDLEKWSEDQWKAFIKKWFLDGNHISILGTPSAQLSKRVKDGEEKRVAERKQKLGEDGLKDLADKLAKAKKENDIEIPRALLEKFPIPGADSIHFISTTTARSGEAQGMGPLDNDIQKAIDEDAPASPLFIHFEHIPSNFVQIVLIVSTSTIPLKLRPLLPVYFENFFNTPVMRDGKEIPFEDVVLQLERDTVSYDIDEGSYDATPENVRVSLHCEPEKYETMIKWLLELFSKPVFDKMRLGAGVTKLLADVPDEKRSGNDMMASVGSMIQYTQDSITRASDTLVKAVYLKRIKKLLHEKPEDVLLDMETLRSSLFQFCNIRVLVVADVLKLTHPASAWQHFSQALDTSVPLKPLDRARDRLSDSAKSPGNLAYVVPMAPIDSSFSLHVTKGPSSWDDPQVPALMVAVAYLDAVEGPLWTAVRGTGLAYGTGFGRSIESGTLRFRIYRSPNAFKAFEASRKVVGDLIEGAVEFDPSSLEGAVSSIIVGFADEVPTMSSAAYASFINQVVKGLPKDHNAKMLKKVKEVGVAEIKKAMKDILLPVFEPKTSNVIVTCAPILEKDITEGFNREGFNTQVQPLSHFQDDYGLKGQGDEEEGEEEGEEEEEEEEDEKNEDDQEEVSHDEL